MKKIDCLGPEVLRNSDVYDEIRSYINNYRKAMLLALVISLPFWGIALVIVAAFGYYFVIPTADTFAQAASTLLSLWFSFVPVEGFLAVISTLTYGVLDLICLSPMLLIFCFFGLMAWQSIITIFRRDPNVARAIYFADNQKEMNDLTIELADLPKQLIYRIFKENIMKIINFALAVEKKIFLALGILKKAKSEDLGDAERILVKTGDKVQVIDQWYAESKEGLTNNFKVITKETEEYFIMIYMIKGNASFFNPEVIVITNIKNKEKIVNKLDDTVPVLIKQRRKLLKKFMGMHS